MSEIEALTIIALRGELEIGRKAEIRRALCAAPEETRVLLDLSQVTYADSIALTELLRFCVEVQREGRRCALLIQTPQFARLIQYAGLATVFRVFSDRPVAIAYLMQGPQA